METFNFPYHRFNVRYPENSFRVQLGNSWTFTAAPDGPDQRLFRLNFPVMKYFWDDDEDEIDLESHPEINLGLLEQFYQEHKLYKTFLYPHPVYGELKVKFNRPLEIPDGEPGGRGAVKNITVELVEIP